MDYVTCTHVETLVREYARLTGLKAAWFELTGSVPEVVTNSMVAVTRRVEELNRAKLEIEYRAAKAAVASLATRAEKRKEAQRTVKALADILGKE